LSAHTAVASGRTTVRCACNHLTDFGLLVGRKAGSSDDVALPVAVAVSVSVAACVVIVVGTIIAALAIRRRQRLRREMGSLASAVNLDRYDGLHDNSDEL
jgi:hypothetical protein